MMKTSDNDNLAFMLISSAPCACHHHYHYELWRIRLNCLFL